MPIALEQTPLYQDYTYFEVFPSKIRHFSNFAYDYIIPEHIFNDETGIGYDG